MNATYIQKSSQILKTCTPILHLKRFRGKINIQRPRQPHYDRALFNAVTQPLIPEQTVYEKCYKNELTPTATISRKPKVHNPYELIIAKDIENWFNKSKMIAVFHMNSINSDDIFKARVAFHKENMQLKSYGKPLMQMALYNSRYKEMLPLFSTKNCIIFSQEQNVDKLLKISKKIPQLILLAGIVEDRLMSTTQIFEFSALPDIQIVRAQFVAVLNSIGGSVVNSLEAHQNNFVALLDSHAQSMSTTSTTPPNPTAVTTDTTETKE